VLLAAINGLVAQGVGRAGVDGGSRHSSLEPRKNYANKKGRREAAFCTRDAQLRLNQYFATTGPPIGLIERERDQVGMPGQRSVLKTSRWWS